MEDIKQFKARILKIHDTRTHKVTNSLGVYDSYKWLRKNKWLDIGHVDEHTYYTIIREVNKLMAQELGNGNPITLPHRLGKLELRKNSAKIYRKDGKVKTNLPIDWNRTLELWENDKEAFRDKTVLRYELDYIYKLKYNPYKAKFNNKTIFQFKFIRDIKQGISKEIQKGNIDAILKYK